MTALIEKTRLRLLIVEDRKKGMENRKRLFEAEGFEASGVTSLAEAMRELEVSPGWDIVVTDINLVAEQPEDRSGLEVARRARRLQPAVPVIGYSAHFSPQQLQQDDPQPFTEYFTEYLAKGRSSPKDISERIQHWKDLALQYRKNRKSKSDAKLKEFKRDYNLTEAEFETLRDFLPATPPIDVNDVQTGDSSDEFVPRAGYKLRFVHPRTRVASDDSETSTDDEVETVAPVAVWLCRADDAWVAELYGHTAIYASGANEEAAVGSILTLMLGYHQDFSNTDEGKDSPELIRLRRYLNHVFR